MERLEELKKRLKERSPELELREREPMSRYTTFRIGGPAVLMALPRNMAEVKAALKTARELEIPPFFLGNGSNLLVADGILYKRRGIGMFVSKGAGETVKQKRKAAFYDGFVKPLVKEGASLALTGEEITAMIEQAVREENDK